VGGHRYPPRSGLVSRPKYKNVIGTKWVFKNKLNEVGQATRKKDRLVCKGYAQVEGIEFEEKFSPTAPDGKLPFSLMSKGERFI
jgi:hypothetical protein